MRVSLIAPPLSLRPLDLPPRHFPYMLAMTAAVLERAGIEARILDAFLDRLGPEEILGRLTHFDPDVVVLAPFDYTRETPIEVSVEIAKTLKASLPRARVGLIGGGDLAHFMKHFAPARELDFLSIGDPEGPILDYCLALPDRTEAIPGLAVRRASRTLDDGNEPGDVRFGGHREPLADLDTLPFPAWHLVGFERYRFAPHRYKRWPLYPLWASRGCPNRCTFCKETPFSKKQGYRVRSPRNVLEEITDAMKTFGAREIQFEDSTFGARRAWVEELCESISRAGLDIAWSCLTRVDTVDAELLRKMRAAGCWNILFGVESGSLHQLELIGKGTTLEQAERAFRLTQDAGIEATASFVLGLPGESPEVARETVRFARRLRPDYASFFIVKAHFDEEGARALSRYGRISDRWDLPPHEFRGPIFIPFGYRDEAEMKMVQKKAYRGFYLRPSYILGRLARIRGLSDVVRYLRGIAILIGL